MSKLTVSLFYRDGNNDKTFWDIEVERQLLLNILGKEIYNGEVSFRNEDIEIEEFGLSMMHNIPFPFGYCPEFDHNFVTITEVDGIETKDYIMLGEKHHE